MNKMIHIKFLHLIYYWRLKKELTELESHSDINSISTIIEPHVSLP